MRTACSGLTLAGFLAPAKATPSLSSAGHGRENTMKGSWVEITIGQDHALNTIMGKTDWNWGY